MLKSQILESNQKFQVQNKLQKLKLKSKIKLSALEIDDLECMIKIENYQQNWKYSNTISPL